MPGYDRCFEQWKPVAIKLRQSGWPPQAICRQLALDIFGDKTKYNTVKGWYQRTFHDWSSEVYKAQPRENRPPQNCVLNQHRFSYHPKTSAAGFPSQQRQSFPQHEHSQASNSYHSPNYPHFHAMQDTLPSHDETAIYQSARQAYPLGQQYLPMTFADSSVLYQLGSPQDLSGDLNLQMSPEQYSMISQHDGLAPISDGYTSQLAVESKPSCEPDDHRFQQLGYVQQGMTRTNERSNLINNDELDVDRNMNRIDVANDKTLLSLEQFLKTDSPDASVAEVIGTSGPARNLSMDDQRFTMQCSSPPKQSLLAYDEPRHHPPSIPTHQRTSQAADEPLATGTCYDQLPVLPSQWHLSSTSVQHVMTRASNKHCRSISVLADPTPPPQYPLPPNPPARFGVIHKRGDLKDWRPVRVQSGSMVTVDPNRLPTDHPPKRLKGVATESRDSLDVYLDHLKAPHLVAPETSASHAEQAASARAPSSLRSVDSSNASIHSSLRDSGYISLFIQESLQSAFSDLKLTDAECKTDCQEAGDGFVNVEIKGRMRISYIEKMHSPILGPAI